VKASTKNADLPFCRYDGTPLEIMCRNCGAAALRQQPADGEAQKMAARLREIRERCEAATPGPWGSPPWVDTLERWALHQIREGRDGSTEYVAPFAAVDGEADRDFIAHAREDVPFLLDFILTQDARIRELERMVEKHERTCLD
jgi:hypothetical protein